MKAALLGQWFLYSPVGNQVADRGTEPFTSRPSIRIHSETDDAELMLKIQQSDEGAFRELLDRYLTPLNRFAVRMLGNGHDAEDVVQETFLRVWKNARQWQPGHGKLTTWLHSITHHLCIDYHRRDRSTLHSGATELLASNDKPDDHLTAADMSTAVTAAVTQLPERQKSAIILCHYQGFSNRAAAEVIGVSVDALESLMARGRRTLRKKLIGLSAQSDED